MARLTIRPARSNDGAAMAAVRRAAILGKTGAAYPQATLDAWLADATTDHARRYEHAAGDPERIVLVADAGGEDIGFAIAAPAREELRAIYVKPNPIGGVGRALLDEVEKHAFQSARSLSCVAALNAVPFYEANGYTRQGDIEYTDSSGSGVPCVRMKKIRPAPSGAARRTSER